MTETQRGRPRSTERHHAILECTRTLLANGTYEQLTIEAIAAGAGVSKQTVYKWWPSKAAVVTEAVIAGYVGVEAGPPADTGDIGADMAAWFHAQIDQLTNPAASALTRAMTAATAESANSERIFEQLAEPTRQYLVRRLAAAVRQGELRPDADLVAAADAILSTILLHSLSPADGNAHAHADGLLDILLHGMTRKRRPSRKVTDRPS